MKDLSGLVGYFKHSEALERAFTPRSIKCEAAHRFDNPEIMTIKDFISPEECNALMAEVNTGAQLPVGVNGYRKHYREGDKVCSGRSTLFSEALAQIFFQRIGDLLGDRYSPYGSHELHRPIGVNPAMRIIDYRSDGYLVPHYDLPYKESEDTLSLYTLVIALTSNPHGGATRFIREYRIDDESDWDRAAHEDEVLLQVNPVAGTALLFPHNLLHEGQITAERKTILRTDVMYRRK